MTTLVTGATGFVGSAVTRHVLGRGDAVRVLVRPGSERANIEGLPLEVALGDLLEPATLRPAVAGVRTLFHVAADYRLWAPRPEVLYRTNVDGTKVLLHAALEAGVEQIVYTSSVAVLAAARDGVPADETTPSTLADMIGHYKRSKFLAEEAVRELAAAGAPVVIVNPSTPVGPRDLRPTPTGRMVLEAARGRMPVYIETGLNVVHVDDVAHGHVLALERGRPGERYILGGENLPLEWMLALIARLTGRRPPRRKIRPGTVLPLAYIAELGARLTGREPLLTVDGVRMSRKPMYFTSAKAERELGYTSRPAEQAIADALAWYRARGRLA